MAVIRRISSPTRRPLQARGRPQRPATSDSYHLQPVRGKRPAAGEVRARLGRLSLKWPSGSWSWASAEEQLEPEITEKPEPGTGFQPGPAGLQLPAGAPTRSLSRAGLRLPGPLKLPLPLSATASERPRPAIAASMNCRQASATHLPPGCIAAAILGGRAGHTRRFYPPSTSLHVRFPESLPWAATPGGQVPTRTRSRARDSDRAIETTLCPRAPSEPHWQLQF